VTGDDGRRAPPPLPEAERRAWLDAMGIPLWLPRGGARPRATAEAAPAVEVEPDAATDSKPREEAAVETVAAGESPEALEAVAAAPATAAPAADRVPAMDWAELRATVRDCRACALCEGRTQAVFGVGNQNADLLVLGEGPGQEEDRRGEPFVGPAGQLLDRMLAAIGLDRQTVYITNVVKCRPPRNREPQAAEAQACAPYLRRQIELMQPRLILAIGRVAAQQLLDTTEPLGRLRGRWHHVAPGDTPVRVSYHPAFLLRQPGEKRKAWEDLKIVRDELRTARGPIDP